MSATNVDVDSSSTTADGTGNEIFEYSHIIVPSTMRSRYWQYFGFPCDTYHNIVTRKKIICTLCNTAITYNKNTTNLRTHLVARHAHVLYQINEDKKAKLDDKGPGDNEEWKEKVHRIKIMPGKSSFQELPADEKHPKISEQTTIIESLVDSELIENEGEKVIERSIYQDYSSVLDPQTYQVEEIDESSALTHDVVIEAASEMLVKDLLPPSILEGSGFTNFAYTICPAIVLPSRNQIEKNLNCSFETLSTNRLESIKLQTSQGPYSLSFDVWQNIERKQFATIHVNYLWESETGQQLKSDLLKTVCLSENISLDTIPQHIDMTKCTAAIVNCKCDDVQSFLNKYEIPQIPCFVALIQKCFQSVFEVPEVQMIIQEVRKEMITNSWTSESHASNLLPTTHDQIPLTIFNMLSHFYDNSTSYTSWAEESKLFQQIKILIDCLSPLKMTLEMIADEPTAFCSLLKPLITKLLNEYFFCLDDERGIESTIKQLTTRVLSEWTEHQKFLEVATFFDPRFLNYIDSERFESMKAVINSKVQGTTDNAKLGIKDDDNMPNKRKSSLKMFFKNDDLKRNPKAAKTSAELEIQKYTNEACDMDQCPITWWNECGFVYRHLKSVAQFYICVPAAVDNLYRRTINEQIDFHSKRALIRSEFDQKLLFLHLINKTAK